MLSMFLANAMIIFVFFIVMKMWLLMLTKKTLVTWGVRRANPPISCSQAHDSDSGESHGDSGESRGPTTS